jgi:hypothetical protein
VRGREGDKQFISLSPPPSLGVNNSYNNGTGREREGERIPNFKFQIPEKTRDGEPLSTGAEWSG